MAQKFLKRTWHKISVAVLVFFIVLIVIFSFLVNKYWAPVLAGKIKDVVLKSSDSLYKIDFSDAELHVLRGKIVFYNITLKPDTAIYNKKLRQHLAPNNLVELHIRQLTLVHIHPFTLYFKHRLEIGEIILNNPQVNMSYQLNHTRDTILKDNRTPWQKISKSLHSIKVESILLGDVKFRYKDYSGNKLVISELKELNLSAHDLLIDSATQTDRSRLLYCKDIVAELNNYTGKTSNGLYTYKINSLKLSTAKSRLDVQGITLNPIETNDFFTKSHKDRFTLRLDTLQLNNFDFLNYHKYRILTASSLILTNGSVQIFSNPNHTNDTSNRIKTFPNVALFKMADIKIDTVLIHHINVDYNEYNIKSKKTGSITFNNTNGQALNITTNKTALQKNNSGAIQLTSCFMNRGKFSLQFNFNLTDKNNSFIYQGMLEEMNLQAINPAVMPLAMIKINSGTLKQLNFDIKANDKTAKGKVVVLYNNLKVNILKADTDQDKLKNQLIASLYANIFILKHDNPDIAGGQPRSVYVTYNRKPQTPFFGFMWQTLLTGLKPAIGLDKKTEQATTAMLSKQVINKQNRKIKKEQRKKRRAERKRKRKEKSIRK